MKLLIEEEERMSGGGKLLARTDGMANPYLSNQDDDLSGFKRWNKIAFQWSSREFITYK